MTKKTNPNAKQAHSADPAIQWRKLKIGVEADYLDALSEDEIAQELDQDIDAMSDLEQKRVGKALDRLQGKIRNIVQAEQAKIHAYSQHGQRAAADHQAPTPDSAQPNLGYAPLARSLVIAGRTFGLGVATKRPREIVLVGELPDNAIALRIGTRRVTLVATNDPRVHRCRDLGEPQLKTLLNSSPPPEIEIIVDTSKS